MIREHCRAAYFCSVRAFMCLQDWASCLLEQVSRGDLEQAAAAANTPAAGRRRSLPAAYSISGNAGKQPSTSAAGVAAAPAAAAAGAGGMVQLAQVADVQQQHDATGKQSSSRCQRSLQADVSAVHGGAWH
jgi:hypothetical protein